MNNSVWYLGTTRPVSTVGEYISSPRKPVGRNVEDHKKLTHFYVDYIGNREPKHARIRFIPNRKWLENVALPIVYRINVQSLTNRQFAYTSELLSHSYTRGEHITHNLPADSLVPPFTITAEFRIADGKESRKRARPTDEAAVQSGPVKKPNLDIGALYDKSEFNDLLVKCKDRTFRVSKLILAASSSVFQAMFSSNMSESVKNELTIENFEPDEVDLLFKYLYTGVIDKFDDRVDQVVAIADYYQVETLRDECVISLIRTLTPTNVLDRLSYAHRFNNRLLKKSCLEFAHVHLNEV